MKSFWLIISCFLIKLNASAQEAGKYPFYKNSITLEFTNPAQCLSGAQYDFKTPHIPIALNWEFRINNKFYGEAGIIAFGGDFADNKAFLNFGAFVGGLIKLRIANHFYFTPSLDLFLQRLKLSPTNSINPVSRSTHLGVGPSLGFEYFLSKRLSVNLDLLQITYGFMYYDNQDNAYHTPNYFNEHGYFNIYKLYSVGVHYNFNMGKQK